MTAAESLSGEQPATRAFRELVENELPACLRDLVTALQETAMTCGGAAAEVSMPGELAAAIGFAGEHLRGSLVVRLPADLARRLSPVSCLPDRSQLMDFTGELANQLLGRLKNRLLRFGVDVHLSTPTALSAEQLRTLGDDDAAVSLTAACMSQPLDAWLTAEVEAGLVLEECDEEPQAEGEDLFF